MSETRKLAAILAADVVGYSRLTGADEDRTLARLRALRSDLIDPTIAVHKGRVVKRTGDGALVEFRSVVDAVRCAIEVQNGMVERNAGLPQDRRIEFRIGIHLGDVVEESDGDLMGDGVNIAARLEGIAMPGAICLSEDAYRQVRARLDLAVSDLGETKLKNIVEPMRVYSLEVGIAAKAKPAAQAEPASPARPGVTLVQSDKPSIAVLPFTNMSGDPAQEYFSDGITEDIITELSRFRSLFVIARNSSFAYKGRAPDLREVGRELGVRYVVEGSVRRAGERVRVTTQLIDTRSGSHLWAERYDRDLKDIFSVQDEITRRIVAGLAPRIEAEDLDLAQRKPPEDMRAYDYYLKAKSLIDSPSTTDDLISAREYCERAIQIDASYARAHAFKAIGYTLSIILMVADDPKELRRHALECAERAVALDPLDGLCHCSLGDAAFHAKQYDRARDHMARALAINPNDADVLAAFGFILAFTGDPEFGLRQMEMAMERNPITPPWYHWQRAIILFMAGQFDEALRAINLYSPPNANTLRWRAMTLMQLGRMDEACADIEALLVLQPDAGVGKIVQYFDYLPRQYTENLRKAGLPE